MPIPNPRALGSRRRTVHLDDLTDLREMLSYMLDHAKSIGRTDPIDVFFPALDGVGPEGIDLPTHTAYLDELAEIGINWALAPIGGNNLESFLQAIAHYGHNVIDR